MNALSIYLTDSATMLRRNVRHMRRYPMIFFIAGIPIVFLLLFVFVLGGTLGAGLGGATGGRAEYVAYVVPGHPRPRRRRRSAGDRDLGRDGHDGGDRRPLPDDVDLAGVVPERSRPGQRPPDDAGDRDRRRRRRRHRVPADDRPARVARRGRPPRA